MHIYQSYIHLLSCMLCMFVYLCGVKAIVYAPRGEEGVDDWPSQYQQPGLCASTYMIAYTYMTRAE